MICPYCGSSEISEYILGSYPTGVVAPDGGREYRTEAEYDCRACGRHDIQPVRRPPR